MSNAIQFDQKDKSAILTYEQLAQTMKLGDSAGNMPRQVPVQPGELLVTVKDMIKRYAGADIIEDNIIIREPYCQTNLSKVHKGEPLQIEDYLIRRFVTKFRIPGLIFNREGEDIMPAIALTYAYTDSIKGIQIAYGENVSVCDNLTAFGPYHFSTYGNSRVTFEEGMQLLTHWIQNLEAIHENHVYVIDYLISVHVNKQEYQRIIGSLFEKAVRSNSGEKGITAPLNQSQVAAMVAAGLETLQDDNSVISAWDVLNWGTSTLKAQNSDMIELLKNTTAFNDFIYSEFDVPVSLAV